jgi:hypothetical protein
MNGHRSLKLVSDYHDYFDFAFDREGELFIRYSRDMLNREDAFRLMRLAGVSTVANGYVKDLLKVFNKEAFVIYLDDKAHAANGKIVVRGEERQMFKDYYASIVYGKPSVSYRYLNIGNRQWKLEYKSDHEFFSNCGDVEITLIEEILYDTLKVPFPLKGRNFWAIDFVANDLAGELAVDYNTSPQIGKTPIENILTPTEVVNLLKIC